MRSMPTRVRWARMSRPSSLADDPVALRSEVMCRFFTGVMARQVRGSFRALRVARPGVPELPDGRPVVVYCNHPSWWDPALLLILADRLFPRHHPFGPMASAALDRYAFMRRVGIFGVPEGRAGAARFLAVSRHVLADPRRMLWMTSQATFADARVRPIGFVPGVAHVMARVPGAVALPMAMEYPFWAQKRPEALVAFGAPLEGEDDAAGWTGRLEHALTATMDGLAARAESRDESAFTALVEGRRGVGGVYDGWRRLRATLAGRPFEADHTVLPSHPEGSGRR